MSIYRHVGLETNIFGYRKLERFGQSIDLPDDVAKGIILGAGAVQGHAGASALLPDAEFQAVGFTDAELRYFATPASWASDVNLKDGKLYVADFMTKKQAALEALHAYRLTLEEANV